MKIVVTINTSWNIYNFRLGLIKQLQLLGHEVIALAPKDEYVEVLKKQNVQHYNISINSKGINPVEDLMLIKDYYKALKTIRPDVVLGYTIKPNVYGGIACQLLKIPIINNVSGLGTLFIKKSFSSYIGQLLYRIAFRKSAHVFFQNKNDRVEFLRLKLVSSHVTSVLPGSGVNLEKFNVIRKNNIGKTFLFIGRLLGDKGIREFIEAANRLTEEDPSLEFRIVGELGYNNRTAITKEELDNWLENRQINYFGKQDDMVKILADCDVMVLPSYREGLSKSLIEAAAMFLPLVTTDVPGCREVVEEGKNGFLCNVKDANDLYTKMKKVVSLTEQERLNMGNYSRAKVEREFDEKIVIQNYLEAINNALAK